MWRAKWTEYMNMENKRDLSSENVFDFHLEEHNEVLR